MGFLGGIRVRGERVCATREYFPAQPAKVTEAALFKEYLRYVRQTNEEALGERDVLTNAYGVALTNVGLDYGSGSIWVDYLTFLDDTKVRERNMSFIVLQGNAPFRYLNTLSYSTSIADTLHYTAPIHKFHNSSHINDLHCRPKASETSR